MRVFVPIALSLAAALLQVPAMSQDSGSSAEAEGPRCIQLARVTDLRVLDQSTIIFEMRDAYLVNVLSSSCLAEPLVGERGRPDMRGAICADETPQFFRRIEPCTFGEFLPVSKERGEALLAEEGENAGLFSVRAVAVPAVSAQTQSQDAPTPDEEASRSGEAL